MCAPLERFDHITQKIRYVDSLITFLFPSAIIIAFDIAIGYKVRDHICHRSSSTLEDRRLYNLELEISEQSTMLRTCSEHTQLCQRQTNSVRSRSVCEYHRPAINETRMLNLPDNIADVRDNGPTDETKAVNDLHQLGFDCTIAGGLFVITRSRRSIC